MEPRKLDENIQKKYWEVLNGDIARYVHNFEYNSFDFVGRRLNHQYGEAPSDIVLAEFGEDEFGDPELRMELKTVRTGIPIPSWHPVKNDLKREKSAEELSKKFSEYGAVQQAYIRRGFVTEDFLREELEGDIYFEEDSVFQNTRVQNVVEEIFGEDFYELDKISEIEI